MDGTRKIQTRAADHEEVPSTGGVVTSWFLHAGVDAGPSQARRTRSPHAAINQPGSDDGAAAATMKLIFRCLTPGRRHVLVAPFVF
jgi:hypothetical protein